MNSQFPQLLKDSLIDLLDFFWNSFDKFRDGRFEFSLRSTPEKLIKKNRDLKKFPCLITEAFSQLTSKDILSLQKEKPLLYFNYIFLFENYYETLFETNPYNIFKPDRKKVHDSLQQKYAISLEKYALDQNFLNCFYEKIEDLFEKMFKYFILYIEKKNYRNDENIQKNIRIAHIDLSPYSIKSSPQKQKSKKFFLKCLKI